MTPPFAAPEPLIGPQGPGGRLPPPAARVLGFAGLIPNLLAVLAEVSLRGRPGAAPVIYAAGMSAQVYAALILSFLGGMWWGVAASRVAPERLWGWLAIAVAPSLVAAAAFVSAWIAAPPLGIAVVLSTGLVLSLLGDRRLSRAGLVPGWWMRLRVPLSVGLAIETLASALIG